MWRWGDTVLEASSKYHLRQQGVVVQLTISKLQGEDSGEYSCETGDRRVSANLTVKGRVTGTPAVLSFTNSLSLSVICFDHLVSLHSHFTPPLSCLHDSVHFVPGRILRMPYQSQCLTVSFILLHPSSASFTFPRVARFTILQGLLSRRLSHNHTLSASCFHRRDHSFTDINPSYHTMDYWFLFVYFYIHTCFLLNFHPSHCFSHNPFLFRNITDHT